MLAEERNLIHQINRIYQKISFRYLELWSFEQELFSCTNICAVLHLPVSKPTSQRSEKRGKFGNEAEKTLLTVQEDMVTFTPAAPQRRIVQAGAADLDGVVHCGVQVQRRPGFSRHGHGLDTQKPWTVGHVRDSRGSISSPVTVSVTFQVGGVVPGEYRTSYLKPVLKLGSAQWRISLGSMVCSCERLTGGAGFTGQHKNDHVCYYERASQPNFNAFRLRLLKFWFEMITFIDKPKIDQGS